MLGVDKCKSCNMNDLVCKDGFVQLPLCKGMDSKITPYCLRDELPKHFIKEDGSPLFYKEKD